jgi:hypothetical protein
MMHNLYFSSAAVGKFAQADLEWRKDSSIEHKWHWSEVRYNHDLRNFGQFLFSPLIMNGEVLP